ncbi:MAG: PfkB family carbohydrate kinase [Rhizobiaceae bacterium]
MNISSNPVAVFITGAHLDVVGRLNFAPVNGVSNPGKMKSVPGGISLNMASTAVQLGLNCIIIGPIGDDLAGAQVRDAISERGIIDGMTPGGETGIYTSILAPNGSLVIAIADLEIYEKITAASIFDYHGEALSKAKFWMLNTNVPASILTEIVREKEAGFSSEILIAAATISPAKAPHLVPILEFIDVLFTNKLEAMSLLGKTGAQDNTDLCGELRRSGVKSGTMSDGAEALFWWSGEDHGTLSPSRPENIASVTGAGDALAGSVLAGLAKGLNFEMAVKNGMAAAKLTLQSDGPVCLQLNWEKLESEIITG